MTLQDLATRYRHRAEQIVAMKQHLVNTPSHQIDADKLMDCCAILLDLLANSKIAVSDMLEAMAEIHNDEFDRQSQEAFPSWIVLAKLYREATEDLEYDLSKPPFDLGL